MSRENNHWISKFVGTNNFMILFTGASNIFGNILNISAGLMVLKWLEPTDLGYFNSFTIVAGYVVMAHLGLPVGLNRNLPLLLGNKKEEEAHELASNTKLWTFSVSLLITVIGLGFIGYFLIQEKYLWSMGCGVIIAHSWQGIFVTKYLKILYRTNKDFNKLSTITLVTSIVSFCSVYLIFLFGLYGLFLRALAIVVVDFSISWYWRPIRVKMKYDKKRMKTLFTIGFPIFLVNNLYGKWPLVQRTLILSIFGINGLGLFSLVFVIGSSFSVLSNSISSVLFPGMMMQWGKGMPIGQIVRKNLFLPLLMVSILLLVSVPVIWYALPTIIITFLPSYVDIILTAQWMTIASLVGAFRLLGVFYNIINKQRDRLIMYLIGITGWFLVLAVAYLLDQLTMDVFPKALIVGNTAMLVITIWFIRINWSGRIDDAKNNMGIV